MARRWGISAPGRSHTWRDVVLAASIAFAWPAVATAQNESPATGPSRASVTEARATTAVATAGPTRVASGIARRTEVQPPRIEAARNDIIIDGKLDEPAWSQATI